MLKKLNFIIGCIVAGLCGCSKSSSGPDEPPVPVPQPFIFKGVDLGGGVFSQIFGHNYHGVPVNTVVKLHFSAPVDHGSVNAGLIFELQSGLTVSYTASFENDDSILVVVPEAALSNLTHYHIALNKNLTSKDGIALKYKDDVAISTVMDSTDKFPALTDDALLDLAQKQTFKYFWDFGHPTSGLARERNTSGDVCTTGGTGFGIMCMIVAANRNFITKAEALQRIQKIVSFYKNNCTAYHGGYAHWINGATGATVPFSTKDDGADLVETSYLMQGLLCARQYFNTADAAETALRNDINTLWNAVDFNWFRKSNEDVLYWHWSPNYNWDMNVKISGWNEALIVYALAASSNTSAITKAVYDNGWALNGGMKNGNPYYGITLPLGPASGGPLFFAHYSFLGINPHQLTDAYADYWTQDTAHTKINYTYCVTDSRYYGYSNECWGLTASDEEGGYSAHSPKSDNGTISPTAAISSLPYAPEEAMNALKFYYYKLGDKIWGNYGFVDAFNLNSCWFADSYLAIDQGPEMIMIENYRTGLLWDLFMSCPEIKTGMKALGFSSPHL